MNNIKKYREKNKITQKILAENVGISRPYLSKLERGINEPTIFLAKRISKELKIDINCIFVSNE